ncbi:hypothetical protein FRC08_003674 [Ceratobasidium sp. 394]|nr:hypothetical protein FRC08_003674 [Ceratobasidium sp. 394]
MILDWGIPLKNIKFLGILGSQAGLEHVKSEFPDLEIWFAAADPELTPEGLIKPGLGDTVSIHKCLFESLSNSDTLQGDRLYSTVH